MVTFEAITNYAGEGMVKVRHWETTIQTLHIRDAQALRHELDQAIAEAESEERKLEIRIAELEAAE